MLFEAAHATKRFGGLTAVADISFAVDRGEILGIFGPNGSGKTTLLNLISGILPLSAGRLRWKGAEIHGLAPHRIAALGIVKTFQNPQLFLELTVAENVGIAGHLALKRHLGFGRVRELFRPAQRVQPGLDAQSERILRLCRLDSVRDQFAASLSYGQEKMLGVAMAMMCEPELLLLDEPASGLGEEEIANLEAVLRELRREGVALCVIDHKIGFLGRLADRALALRHGALIAEGRPEAVLNHPDVIEAYLGRQHVPAEA
ncbi:MAG: ABC transporter ATP-binding protein [Alphaproteobacteria bacterium]|nr:ABC transporter ATP-binding protein [Alphaproteobacteria bacterium]